jgi:hypothetical protein
MKKLFIFSLVALYLSTITYFAKAQSSIDGGIIVMPQFTAMLNAQDFTAGKDLDYSLTTGFAGGLSGSYNFNKYIGLEINLIYSKQGENYTGNMNKYKFNGADTASYAGLIALQARSEYNILDESWIPADTAYTAKVSLTYLKIPILLKLTSNTDKTAFFYLNVGPQFDILLSASQTLNGNTVSYSFFNFTTKQLYESSGIDAVLNIGAGFNLTKNLVLTTQVNFDYGLTDAEDKSFVFPGSVSNHVYATNRSATANATTGLRLGLSYKFVDANKISDKFTP